MSYPIWLRRKWKFFTKKVAKHEGFRFLSGTWFQIFAKTKKNSTCVCVPVCVLSGLIMCLRRILFIILTNIQTHKIETSHHWKWKSWLKLCLLISFSFHHVSLAIFDFYIARNWLDSLSKLTIWVSVRIICLNTKLHTC